MSLLPDFDENGRLKPEPPPQKYLPTTGRSKSFFSWENLLVGRCPRCQNYLEENGKVMQCTSESGGKKDCMFTITKERMRELKMEIGYKNTEN